WNWLCALVLFIIFISFTISFAFLLYKSVPIFMIELQELSEHLPALTKDYEEMILTLYESKALLPEAVHDKMDVFISKMETTIDDKITLVLENAFHVSEFVILIATVPVLVFYFLKDRYMILRWLNSLLPKKWR